MRTGKVASFSSEPIPAGAEFQVGDIVRPNGSVGDANYKDPSTFSVVLRKFVSFGKWCYSLQKLYDPQFIFSGTANTHTLVMTKQRLAELALVGNELNHFEIAAGEEVRHLSIQFNILGGPIGAGDSYFGNIIVTEIRDGVTLTFANVRGPIRYVFKYIGNPVSGKVSVFKVDRNGHEEIWELAL